MYLKGTAKWLIVHICSLALRQGATDQFHTKKETYKFLQNTSYITRCDLCMQLNKDKHTAYDGMQIPQHYNRHTYIWMPNGPKPGSNWHPDQIHLQLWQNCTLHSTTIIKTRKTPVNKTGNDAMPCTLCYFYSILCVMWYFHSTPCMVSYFHSTMCV